MKVYLAGGLARMGQEQKLTLGDIATTLRRKGLEVFSPMEHKIPDGEDMDNFKWGQAVYKMDKNAIDNCDVVVACYNGVESIGQNGTMWECGYCFAKNIPVIVVCMVEDNSSSLMLANGSYCFVKGLRGLRRYDFNKMRKNTYMTYVH